MRSIAPEMAFRFVNILRRSGRVGAGFEVDDVAKVRVLYARELKK